MSDEDKENIEVVLKWKDALRVQSQIRQFSPVIMDDRKKGNDSAPTPVEMFLSAVGSCLVMSFVYCTYLAGVQDLNKQDFKVKIIGEVDRKRDRLRLIDLRAEFSLKSSSNDKKIRKCFEKFQPFCILSESIKEGISFSCDLNITT